MYEPIRTKSVHTMAGTTPDFPHRSREEELDIQLAGHLAALLAVTDELGLDAQARRMAAQVARLRGAPPVRHAGPAAPIRPPCTGAPTPSPDGPWSSPRPAPTPRPRSSPPSAWTPTPPPCATRSWSAPPDGPGPRAEEARGPGATF